MKKVNLKGKLNLGKETLSKLNGKEMSNLNGGLPAYSYRCLTDPCVVDTVRCTGYKTIC